jgi:hypothetical protein
MSLSIFRLTQGLHAVRTPTRTNREVDGWVDVIKPRSMPDAAPLSIVIRRASSEISRAGGVR